MDQSVSPALRIASAASSTCAAAAIGEGAGGRCRPAVIAVTAARYQSTIRRESALGEWILIEANPGGDETVGGAGRRRPRTPATAAPSEPTESDDWRSAFAAGFAVDVRPIVSGEGDRPASVGARPIAGRIKTRPPRASRSPARCADRRKAIMIRRSSPARRSPSLSSANGGKYYRPWPG